MPETPRWLLSKGVRLIWLSTFLTFLTPTQRDEQATRNLAKMRNLPVDHEYLQWELDQTRTQLSAEELVRGDAGPTQLVRDLFTTPGHRYRLFIGLSLIVSKSSAFMARSG